MKHEKFEANRIMYVEVMSTSCFTSRWRYKCDSILTHRVQDRTLMKREKFEANWVMYVEVMRTSCFMVKCGNSPRRRGKAVWKKLNFFDDY